MEHLSDESHPVSNALGGCKKLESAYDISRNLYAIHHGVSIDKVKIRTPRLGRNLNTGDLSSVTRSNANLRVGYLQCAVCGTDHLHAADKIIL